MCQYDVQYLEEKHVLKFMEHFSFIKYVQHAAMGYLSVNVKQMYYLVN